MENCINLSKTQKKAFFAAVLSISLLAFLLRSVGLYHGLSRGQPFHPDTTKQVQAVENFLHGHLLWYTGSLAYDGYPYGLNHVDAALVRILWPAARTLQAFFVPGQPLPLLPDRTTLFYFCRAFRVLYGMIAFGAFAYALKKLEIPRKDRILWLLLAATAPLLSVVTHSASGDVGTDLFVMLSLLAMIPARAAPSAKAFLFSGFFLGCAFACKYHGILGGIVPGLVLLCAGWPWRKRIQLGLLLGVGTLSGFALLTPHLFIRFSRTLRLIRDNFRYIRRYNVPPEFYEQPAWQRLSESLTSNIPIAANAMGYLLSGVLLLLLAAAIIRFHGRWIAHREAAAWDWAVMIMPIGVLLLALSGKPRVQPFHFSFLPLPFLLAAAIHCKSFPHKLRLLFLLLLIPAIGEQALRQRTEWAHWLREDTRALAFRASENLLYPASEPRNARNLPAIVLEGDNLAVFRNRPQTLRLENVRPWLSHPEDPLPRIPYDLSSDWILLHWPRFPRDATRLHLREGPPLTRVLVDAEHAETVILVLRSGDRPSEVSVRLNREQQTVSLPPFHEERLQFHAGSGEVFTRGGHARVRHHLRLQVVGGSVLADINPPVPGPPVAMTAEAEQRVQAKLAQARFLEGATFVPHGLNPVPILWEQHLPSGRYRIEVDLPEHLPPDTLHVSNAQAPHPDQTLTVPFAWQDARWVAEWEMPAAPLFSHVAITFDQRPGRPVPWRIHPLKGFPEAQRPFRKHVVRFHPMIRYARGRMTLGNLTVPERLPPGAPLEVAPQIQANLRWIQNLDEHVMFYHLLDKDGKQVFARDIPLSRFPFAPAPRRSINLGPLDLPPGTYEVLVGLYQPRTGVRLPPERLQGSRARERRTRIGTLVISSPAD